AARQGGGHGRRHAPGGAERRQRNRGEGLSRTLLELSRNLGHRRGDDVAASRPFPSLSRRDRGGGRMGAGDRDETHNTNMKKAAAKKPSKPKRASRAKKKPVSDRVWIGFD